MKIEFKKEEFVNSLQIVNRAIKKGNIYNILECVYIDATKNRIILTAEDGKEITIKKEAIGEIKEKGKAAVDGYNLYNILKDMPSDSFINLEVNEKKECIVKWGQKGNQKIQARDEETYPNISNVNKENKIIINELKLKRLLEKTLFSYDRAGDSGNVVLKGIDFNIDKENIKVKSMDGYIISISNEKILENDKKLEKVIPGSALEELNKLLKGEANKDVYIYINDKNVGFEFNDTLLTTIIIPNQYIDTDRIFNLEYSTKMKINRLDFNESLRRSINSLTDEDKKPIILDIKDSVVELNLNSLTSDYHEELEIEKTGKDIVIAFNAKNLIKILNVIDDENIFMYFSGPKQPVIIKDKQETYSYLLTPVKI